MSKRGKRRKLLPLRPFCLRHLLDMAAIRPFACKKVNDSICLDTLIGSRITGKFSLKIMYRKVCSSSAGLHGESCCQGGKSNNRN